jgi:predicted DNA-binding protein YlxM (UPF0122 family)
MPDNTSSYITDTHHITLNQLTNKFSHDVSQLIRSKQTPLILELKQKGMTMSEIGQLLGISRQEVYEIIGKQNEKTQ